MKTVEYTENLGKYTLPEGLFELLSGKSIEEQMNYFRTSGSYRLSNTYWSDRTEYSSLSRIDEDDEVKAIIVDNGIIVGVMVKDYNYSCEVACFVEDSVCTYYASDNNGAGYKEREDYFYLYAVK